MIVKKRLSFLGKLAGFVGVVTIGTLTALPALSQFYYGPSFFSPSAYYPARAGSLVGQFKQLGFSKLAEALEQNPELINTLNQGGPFTIFAPTDEAFETLGSAKWDELIKNKQQLAKILSYHIVAGQVTDADVKAGQVKTLEGNSIKINLDNASKQITFNQAKPADNSFNLKNGSDKTLTFVVIDQVLSPMGN